MEFQVLLSDRSFNVVDDITDIIQGLRWDYNRIGGCGNFSFSVPIRFCESVQLGGNFNIKIYIRNTSNTFDLRYQGRIENRGNDVRHDGENITINGTGYQSELADIYVDRDYTSTEISVIVKSILDNDITPNTNITYSAGDLTATSFTPDSLSFNTDALSAMQTLADIVGSREWGVDKDRKFFFKQRSSSVGFRYPLGGKVTSFKFDTSSRDIVNRVVVTGGDVSGSPFTRVVNDAQSQLKWKRRDKVVQNSAITTNAVADQFADAIFTEFSDVVRKAQVEILDDTQIEATIPIPLLQVIGKGATYGTKKYGTGMYNAILSHQVNRVSYQVDDAGVIVTKIQLGQLRPDSAENISQIEFKIDQLRQQGV